MTDKKDIWNENALRDAEETQIKREHFWRGVNRPNQGIVAEREKFMRDLTGSYKVLPPNKDE